MKSMAKVTIKHYVNKNWHTRCQMKWKLLTLNDRKNRHYNKNCIGCSAFSLATDWLFC